MQKSSPSKTSRRRQDKSTILYQNFEYLAASYARKIFGYDKAGYEYQDILQEFKIKIYTSVQAYLKKLEIYKETGRYKPVPIEYYLKCAMVNKTTDLIKKFNSNSDDGVTKISWENQIDIGYENDLIPLEYSFRKGSFSVNGIDMLDGLTSKAEQKCFMMYCQGFSLSRLQRMFAKSFSAKNIISTQVDRLRLKKKELYDFSEKKFEYSLSLESE